jgi:hypothetical protein
MVSNELSEVPDEFIQQNPAHEEIKKSTKRGGPYSKNDKEARREEVYRLHFEYGYSARKIAELMKVNRNTINADIDYWYSIILKNVDYINPVKPIRIHLEQMHIQKTRLREGLDKVKNNSERIAIERLMLDINSKILYTLQKLSDSESRIHKRAVNWLNNYMKEIKSSHRFVSMFETIPVSEAAQQKIRKIIDEELQRVN